MLLSAEICLTVLEDGGRNRSLESIAAKSLQQIDSLMQIFSIKALLGVMDRCRELCIVSVHVHCLCLGKYVHKMVSKSSWVLKDMTDWRWAPQNGIQSSQAAAKSLLQEIRNCAWGLFVLGFTTEKECLDLECLPDTRHLKLFYRPAKLKALCKWSLVCSSCIVISECKQVVGTQKSC